MTTTMIQDIQEAMTAILTALNAAADTGSFLRVVIATDENRAACRLLAESDQIHIRKEGTHLIHIEKI